jgi:hypothetical protein
VGRSEWDLDIELTIECSAISGGDDCIVHVAAVDWNTDINHKVIIRAAPGHEFRGNFNDDVYYVDCDQDWYGTLEIFASYFEFRDIGILLSTTNAQSNDVAGAGHVFENVTFRKTSGANYNIRLIVANSSGVYRNCSFETVGTSHASNVVIETGSGQTWEFYHCRFVNYATTGSYSTYHRGLQGSAGTITVKNCFSIFSGGATTGVDNKCFTEGGATWSGCTNNASSDSTASSANFTNGQTSIDTDEDYYYSLYYQDWRIRDTATKLLGNGADPASFAPTDMEGNTRPTAPDIGPIEWNGKTIYTATASGENGDYTEGSGINTWEGDTDVALTAIASLVIYDKGSAYSKSSGLVALAGATGLSATVYREMRSAEGHRAHLQETSGNSFYCIRIQEDYVRIYNFRLQSASVGELLEITSGSDNVLVDGIEVQSGEFGYGINEFSGTATIRNVVVVSATGDIQGSSGTVFENCSIHNDAATGAAWRGFRATGAIFKNCVATSKVARSGSYYDFDVSGGAQYYCASRDATADDATTNVGCLVSQTYTALFTAPDSGDLTPKHDSPLLFAGTPHARETVKDIDGKYRAWSIHKRASIGAHDWHPAIHVSNLGPADSGEDYTSIVTWESTEQADLTTSKYVEQLRPMGVFAITDNAIDISGWTASAGYHIWLYVPDEFRHDGTSGTGFRWTVQDYNNAIYTTENFTHVEGMAFINDSAEARTALYYDTYSTAGYGVVRDCFGDGKDTAYRFVHAYTDAIVYAINCRAMQYDVGYRTEDADAHLYTYCCQSVDPKTNGSGFSIGAGKITAMYCIAEGDGTGSAFVGTMETGSAYNWSDDGTAPNTNEQSGTITYVGSGDYDLVNTDTNAKDVGAAAGLSLDPIFPILDDMYGTERPVDSNWDIGPHEAPAAPSPYVPGVTRTQMRVMA